MQEMVKWGQWWRWSGGVTVSRGARIHVLLCGGRGRASTVTHWQKCLMHHTVRLDVTVHSLTNTKADFWQMWVIVCVHSVKSNVMGPGAPADFHNHCRDVRRRSLKWRAMEWILKEFPCILTRRGHFTLQMSDAHFLERFPRFCVKDYMMYYLYNFKQDEPYYTSQQRLKMQKFQPIKTLGVSFLECVLGGNSQPHR